MSGTFPDVEWPGFFSGMLQAVSVVNIDIEMLVAPINGLFAWLGKAATSFACNATDLGFLDLFRVHLLIMPILIGCLLLAYAIAWGLNASKFKPELFGDERFKPVDARAKLINSINFFV